jgi:sugar phosphate isomerase/epimerase
MKKGKIGVQMMMLKSKVNEFGVYETMRGLKELGYYCIEMSQIPMTAENVAEFKRGCEDFNIKVAAISASLEPATAGAGNDALTDNFDKIVSDCKALNCKFIRIGMLPLHLLESKEKVMEFVTRAEEMAERLAQHGIQLYYHNHEVEFQKYDGEYLLDIIKNNTSKLGFELDVHWIQRGGENPIEFVKKYAGRVTLLHLKDYRIGQLDISALKSGDRAKVMLARTNVVQFAEIGEGNLDMKGIIETGLASGSEYFLIEQDATYGRDPFECLRISGENLRKLGYSDWF